jgi:hypothetical protein
MKTNLKSQSNRVLRTLAKLSTELLRDNSSHIREVFGDHTEVLLSSVRQTQRAKAMDVQQKVNTLIDTLEESLVKPRRALDDGHVPNLRQQNVFRTIRKSLHHLIQIRHKITTNEGLRRAPMIPVFLSHRFVGDLYNRRIMKTVRDALLSFGAYPLRARPSGSLLGDYTIHQEVNARMWAAEAGIVIMTSTPGQRDNIGQNIPHELGFLLGQGKSVCILAEEGLSTWANLQGVYYPHFPSHDIAYQRTVRGSIHDLVGEFVASVRKNKQIRSLHP